MNNFTLRYIISLILFVGLLLHGFYQMSRGFYEFGVGELVIAHLVRLDFQSKQEEKKIKR